MTLSLIAVVSTDWHTSLIPEIFHIGRFPEPLVGTEVSWLGGYWWTIFPLKSWIFFRLLMQLHKLSSRSQLRGSSFIWFDLYCFIYLLYVPLPPSFSGSGCPVVYEITVELSTIFVSIWTKEAPIAVVRARVEKERERGKTERETERVGGEGWEREGES